MERFGIFFASRWIFVASNQRMNIVHKIYGGRITNVREKEERTRKKKKTEAEERRRR